MLAQSIRIAPPGGVAVTDEPVPYLYCLLRVVPDLDRDEAMNVGLILFCRPQRLLRVRWHLDAPRLTALAPGLPLEMIAQHLTTLTHIALAEPAGGPVAGLDMGERFHWLSNISNTMIQPGPVRPGLTTDAAATMDRLYRSLVASSGSHP